MAKRVLARQGNSTDISTRDNSNGLDCYTKILRVTTWLYCECIFAFTLLYMYTKFVDNNTKLQIQVNQQSEGKKCAKVLVSTSQSLNKGNKLRRISVQLWTIHKELLVFTHFLIKQPTIFPPKHFPNQEGIEHLLCEERLRNQNLFSLEKK